MKIAHLSLDLFPLVGTTSAAMAVGDLVRSQSNAGEDVLVMCRGHAGDASLPPYLARRLSPLVVKTSEGSFEVSVMEGTLPGSHARVFVLGLPHPRQNAEAFGQAVESLVPTMVFLPELIHLHDDTGVNLDSLRERLDGVAMVQSIYHANTDSPSLLIAIQDADAVTVPCRGLWETAPERQVAQALAAYPHLRVVLGGLDLSRWNPATDPVLEANFTPEALQGKAACRKALQRKAGLAPRVEPVLLLLWLRRAGTEDLQMLKDLWEELRDIDVQIVVFSQNGSVTAASPLKDWEKQGKAWIAQEASDTSLRGMLAGADAVCLPEQEAPLGQRALIAMRYGLIPLARRSQAHRDLLVEYDARSGTGGAFLYDTRDELFRALHRLETTHRDQDAWDAMVRANAHVDAGWSRSLAHWNEVYRKALTR